MNTQSNAMQDSPLRSHGIAPAVIPATRLMYWSIRRELWENRSIYIAPLAVAAVVLLGFLVGLIGLPHHMRLALAADPARQRTIIVMPYDIATGLILLTASLVGFFYCLDALHSERRDRSILFWKSLPVSDLTTVLSKISIPVLLLLFSFVVTVATQLVMLLLSTPVLLGSGLSVTPLWTQVSLFQSSLRLLYHLLTVHALWYAPIYGWLFLVSAWARRAAILWAVLPPLAIGVVEKIAFNTLHFATMVQHRFTGPEHFAFRAEDGLSMAMAPNDLGQFLSTPGLWIGLAIAAAFLAAAVRLRRYRGPI